MFYFKWKYVHVLHLHIVVLYNKKFKYLGFFLSEGLYNLAITTNLGNGTLYYGNSHFLESRLVYIICHSTFFIYINNKSFAYCESAYHSSQKRYHTTKLFTDICTQLTSHRISLLVLKRDSCLVICLLAF